MPFICTTFRFKADAALDGCLLVFSSFDAQRGLFVQRIGVFGFVGLSGFRFEGCSDGNAPNLRFKGGVLFGGRKHAKR